MHVSLNIYIVFHITCMLCRYKAIKWWAQSFMVGIEKIVCGFRDDDGIVHRLQNYTVQDLPKYCKVICFKHQYNMIINNVYCIGIYVNLCVWSFYVQNVNCNEHCKQSVQWWTDVQLHFVWVVQWAVRKLGNSRIVIRKLDVKSDNFSEKCVFCFVLLFQMLVNVIRLVRKWTH